MAVDTALLTRQKVLAAKVETTTGTAISLSGTDGAVNAFDVLIDPAQESTERPAQGSMSELVPAPNEAPGKATFKTEIVGGAGSAPFWMGVLAKGCGFAISSTSLALATGNSTTLTLGMYLSGQLRSIAGAMGKVTFDFESGKPVMASWEFDGVWQTPTASALITPTFPLLPPPRFAGATFTVGGTAYRIEKMQIEIANVVTARRDPAAVDGASYGTGIHAFQIGSRKVNVKMNPEALPLGTKDWFSVFRAGTTAALVATVGSGSGSVVTFGAPALVLSKNPNYEDGQGILRDALEFTASMSAASDDELTIVQA